jgi:N-acylneuraminate cytidylyltransferase
VRVAIIPARGGSRRIPRKNIRDFHGKPILAYSIDAAKATGLFDGGIWVSTEDQEIGEIARKLGAGLIHRPPELAEVDDAPDPGTQEVARHAITVLEGLGDYIDFACCIYATAAFMKARDLLEGYRVLERNPKAAFAYGVQMEPFQDAGQFYWGRAQAFLDRVPLDPYATNVWKIVIERARVLDINTEDDWKRAERIYTELQGATA